MGWTKWMGIGLGLATGAAALATMTYAQSRSGNEQPAFALVKSDGRFELRDYEPVVVAQVTSTGDRRGASGRSFRRLAAYIFGQDRPQGGERIAMTAPVIQEETQTDTWRMRFVMPSQYTLETLPAAPDDITLAQVPARRIAAVTFNGNGSARDLAQMEAVLSDWIGQQGLTPKGDFEYAFYDAPMVPGQLRRNEVLIEVVAQ